MKLPLYQVDAFTSRVFAGNPAAVCPLERWLGDAVLQSIAAENNLPETAFFVREDEGYRLRWFTPTREVDLCGHATLASAHVLFEVLDIPDATITFASRSGPLHVTRDGARLVLDFPARVAEPIEIPGDLVAALGRRPREVRSARDLLAVFDTGCVSAARRCSTSKAPSGSDRGRAGASPRDPVNLPEHPAPPPAPLRTSGPVRNPDFPRLRGLRSGTARPLL